MEKERLPRWGWLLLGLFLASLVSSVLNLIFVPALFSETYQSITVITTMAPVLIYVGVWYDEDRRHYWEHSRLRIVGDVLFVVIGAALGSSIALVAVVDLGLPNFVQDVIAMGGGFLLAWGLFWWRNPDIYSIETDR
jgi:carbon starvation protein CstA